MKLSVKKELKKSILKISIGVTDLTPEEDKMIKELGDPDFIFSKKYGKYDPSFNRKLKASTINLRFDVDTSSPVAAKEVGDFFSEFVDDLEVEVERIMSDMEASYELLGIDSNDEYRPIDY